MYIHIVSIILIQIYLLFQSDSQKPDSENCLNENNAIITHRTSIDLNKSQSHNVTIIESSSTTEHKSTTLDTTSKSSDNICSAIQSEIDDSNVNFSHNRELWQRRANLESTIPVSAASKTQRYSESYIQRQNHTPDLVMDLPLVGNSSPKETVSKSVSVIENLCKDASPVDLNLPASPTKSLTSPTGGESPDMQTAAETFAKQNQCTLKKNTKIQIDNSDLVKITSPIIDRKYATIASSTTSTTTFKPQPKAKPLVLKKPVFSMPLRSVSIEMMCNKDPPDLPT